MIVDIGILHEAPPMGVHIAPMDNEAILYFVKLDGGQALGTLSAKEIS